jgi:hypothetical protein
MEVEFAFRNRLSFAVFTKVCFVSSCHTTRLLILMFEMSCGRALLLFILWIQSDSEIPGFGIWDRYSFVGWCAGESGESQNGTSTVYSRYPIQY